MATRARIHDPLAADLQHGPGDRAAAAQLASLLVAAGRSEMLTEIPDEDGLLDELRRFVWS